MHNPEEHPIDILCVRTLLLSVLRRAMDDWALYRIGEVTKKQRKIRDDARLWLFEDLPLKTPLDSFMSLKNICLVLDLSVSMVRKTANTRTKDDVRKISFND